MVLDRFDYHKKIFRQFSKTTVNINFSESFKNSDGGDLHATALDSDSSTGIIFVPGIWYPREAYYKLICQLNKKYKVLIYDQRGHSYSHGDFCISSMIKDLQGIIKQYSKKNSVQNLFIIGHSMGGYISALATAYLGLDKVAGQILLAPPISMSSTQRKIPTNISTFKIYIINLVRSLKPKYRSEIVREYVSFWYPRFIKKPYLFALRANNPEKIINEIKSTRPLTDILKKCKINTICFWGNKDSTLGIQGRLPQTYLDFVGKMARPGNRFRYQLLDNLSHQFNFDSKRIIYVAGDNDIIENKIFDFIN